MLKAMYRLFAPAATVSACLFLSVCIVVLTPSCKINYSFSGASVSPDLKTVTINYFRNNAPLAKPTLVQSLNDALKDYFTSQTKLAVVQRDGDLVFDGTIISYLVAPVAIQSNDQAALNRLTIAVSVKHMNAKDPKQDFETTFTRFADFSSSQNLADVEDELIRQINDQLVQDIFNKALVNW